MNIAAIPDAIMTMLDTFDKKHYLIFIIIGLCLIFVWGVFR